MNLFFADMASATKKLVEASDASLYGIVFVSIFLAMIGCTALIDILYPIHLKAKGLSR